MDKATPKDMFQANRDRAAPLLAKLKSEGIGHMIDGKAVSSISGQTFETKSPVDGAVLLRLRDVLAISFDPLPIEEAPLRVSINRPHHDLALRRAVRGNS